jgi:pimeloyl-ACP methyl ester carboxylesterase
VEFGVLGPVLVDGKSPPGAIERTLLARLLVAPGTPVPAEELIEAAWPQLVIYEGAGHSPHWERPLQATEDILAFVQQQRARGLASRAS